MLVSARGKSLQKNIVNLILIKKINKKINKNYVCMCNQKIKKIEKVKYGIFRVIYLSSTKVNQN